MLSDMEMDTEANRFAIELLMPAAWVKKDLENMEFDLCEDKQLKSLAKRYGVSMTAMALRLKSLRLNLRSGIES